MCSSYPKPVTLIPPVQRAVIDLTNSRSPTPDNRAASSESGGPSNLRPQLSSTSQIKRESNGRQDNPNPTQLSPRSANHSSAQARTSLPHQVTSNTSGDPSVSPKATISEPPLGQGSPKE